MFKTMLCVLAAVAASPTMTLEEGEDIIQIDFEDPEGQDNRAPNYQLVEGYVDQSAGLAILRFSSPCGTVQFQLENLDDNTFISGAVAGTGIAMIPFSCTPGHWRLTLTFTSGEIYVGEFII